FKKNYQNISQILAFNQDPYFIEEIDKKIGQQPIKNNYSIVKTVVPSGAEEISIDMDIVNIPDVVNLSVPISENQFYSKTFYNGLLDLGLKNNWNKITSGNLQLLQKNKEFTSVEQFLNNYSLDETLFFIDDFNAIKINDYFPSQKINQINLPLRGPHMIYTYIGENEELNWDFNYKELNKNGTADPFIVKVLSADKLEKEIIVKEHNQEDNYNLKIDNLDPGIYLIKLPVDFDIFVKEINTKQKYFAFLDRLDLYNKGLKTDINIFGNELKYKTIHEEGIQNIIFNGNPGKIEDTKVEYLQNLDSKKPSQLSINKSDITIEADGVFYLNGENEFFAKLIYKLLKEKNINDNLDYVNFILTDYSNPISFDLSNVLIDNNVLDIKIEMNNFSDIPINAVFEKINITFYRPFFNYVNNLFD
ncbi:hypothetical protein KKF29_03450, partial [Patescibacteria group bacterium]|nr:hypothetical protein [Patescibacteria group bacterium]